MFSGVIVHSGTVDAAARSNENRLRQSFNAYVAVEYPKLLRSARHLCGDAEEAADLVQDTLTRFWKYFNRFDPSRGSFYTIARIQLKHLFYDKHRYIPRDRQKPLSLDDPNIPRDHSLMSSGPEKNAASNARVDELRKRIDPEHLPILDMLVAGGNVQEHCRSHNVAPSALYFVQSKIKETWDEILIREKEEEMRLSGETPDDLLGVQEEDELFIGLSPYETM